MSILRRFVAPVLAVVMLAVGVTAGPAGAAQTPPAAPAGDRFGDTADNLAVMLADSRFNGIRLPDELVFAFAWSETAPYEASLWLQINEALDVWLPVCAGGLISDGDAVLFIGGSIWGDPDDGCVMGVIGDTNEVLFSAVELEGDAVLTSAMYVVGG